MSSLEELPLKHLLWDTRSWGWRQDDICRLWGLNYSQFTSVQLIQFLLLHEGWFMSWTQTSDTAQNIYEGQFQPCPMNRQEIGSFTGYLIFGSKLLLWLLFFWDSGLNGRIVEGIYMCVCFLLKLYTVSSDEVGLELTAYSTKSRWLFVVFSIPPGSWD